ncbi:membrane protein [Glaciibacter superstes]|uniref:membrane protein n=1 Tax=Glaciibacter superstes TaxID=501023 RepID=UPI00041228D7|nr:membrane protein [Glaciibacter superstes]
MKTRIPVGWRVRYRLVPWWLKVIVVWAVSRLVTTAMVLTLASVQGPNPWTGAHPGYADFANIWDGRWYNIVAMSGYPSVLPLTADGHVTENAWAFMPGYPVIVRGLMELSGQPWAPIAVFVSLGFGLATALLFYRLMVRVLPGHAVLFSVALFCFAPLSPLMQFGYAESMYLFFLTLALLLLLERRYALLFPVIAVMALTRPSGLAFALALALHVVHRWFTRSKDPFPVRERMLSASVSIFSGIMGLAWPVAAWVVTGSITAYTDTELAWRAPYIHYQELIPFTAWFQSGVWWLGLPLGIIVVVAIILAFTLVMLSPAVKRLGTDLRLWLLSYALYLLAVFFPQSSTFRLLVPMFPMLGAFALPRSSLYRSGLLLVAIAGQWGWLLLCWGVDGADWTPP